MSFHFRALLAFLEMVCHPCRANDAAIERHVSAALDEPAPVDPLDKLPEPLYHAVVSEMAEALAAARAASVGDADWAAWSAELAAEGADE